MVVDEEKNNNDDDGMSDRKVHFSVPIHHIEYLDKQWETASRLARDGSNWLRMGLDRQRFKDRIERTGEILNKILDFEFRQIIYKERFENYYSSQDREEGKQQAIIETDNNSVEEIESINNSRIESLTESEREKTTIKQSIEPQTTTINLTQQQQQPLPLEKQQTPQNSSNCNTNSNRRRKKGRRKHRGSHRRRG